MRIWLSGLIAGVLGLGLSLLGDAFHLYRGLWVYLSLVPGVVAAVGFGPVAGLLAGLIAGAAGGQWGVALAVGLWLALVGWVRRWLGDRSFASGLALLLSVPVALTPLVAAGFALGAWQDFGQFMPLLKSLLIALLPTGLVLGIVAWIMVPAHRRFGNRAVTALGIALVAVLPFSARLPAFARSAPPVPVLTRGAEGSYKAGFAKADISPSAEMLKAGVYMGGYGGRPGPATAVHDPIYFRVMALELGNTRVIFVQTDTVGMGNRLGERLRQAAAEKGGSQTIFIGSTHSHAAPDLQGIWGGVPAAYEDFLVNQLSTAVAEAVGKMQPVQLKVAESKLHVARNRRGWDAVPEQMSVLQAVSGSGQVVGTLVNFSVHPTVLPRTNMQLSTDFVGAMLLGVEAKYGGEALFFNGAQGDVVPDPAGLSGSDMYAQADDFGKRLAQGVVDAVNNAMAVPTAAIQVKTTAVRAPLENWGFQALMSLGILRYDMSHASVVPGLQTRVSTIRIGDITMVTVPGEMVTRLWAQVERDLPPGHRFVLGLTQDSLGYIITRDEWATGRNGDYEESVSVGPVMGPLVEKTIGNLVH